ncbi:MAG: hypothetical protein K2X02_00730 [Alphaproteobacteria bacterium]|nr:hypothetical protein [Alphaproteobacteria bacterium]
MSFSQFSIKSLFFLSFFTLIHLNNFCEALNDTDSEDEQPTATTYLLEERRSQTPSSSTDTGAERSERPYFLQVVRDPSSDEEGGSSLPRRRGSSRQQDPNFSRDIPILNIDSENPQRRQITRLFELLKANPGNVALLREDISYETALVIYNLSKAENPRLDDEEDLSLITPARWTDTAYFLNELDKKFFNRSISTKTIVLTVLGAIEGGLAPWGISPLVMYLGENVLNFIPVGGVASDGLVYTIIAITTLPCMMQIGEFMNDIGNAIFDKNGFDTSSEDKGPHIQKTDVVEIETTNQRCCHYIRIPTTLLSRIFSGTSALFRALPMGLLFWDAETPFPEYRNTFLGPLLLFYLVKTYNESMDFYDVFSHQQATEPLPMVKEKKQILRERLKTLQRCVNAEASDRLVEKLYTLIQEELRKKNFPEEGDSKEHISAFSALFVKLSQTRVFEGIQEELDEHVSQHASLRPVVDEIGSLQVPGMAKLIRDIDNKRGKTGARTLLENLSTFDHGAATAGRFFITSWAITTVLMYMGVDPALALYLSFGAAVIDVVSRAIGEWYVQKETFLGLRDTCSRKMAFWPARWTTNTLSFVSAAFFSIPGPAIIFKVMSDCPLYVRSAVALATLPSEFSSFYKFFHDRFDRLINTVTTTAYVRTTSQKREWLNSHIEQAKKFIHRADQSTIEQIYNLTQEGL